MIRKARNIYTGSEIALSVSEIKNGTTGNRNVGKYPRFRTG